MSDLWTLDQRFQYAKCNGAPSRRSIEIMGRILVQMMLLLLMLLLRTRLLVVLRIQRWSEGCGDLGISPPTPIIPIPKY